MLLDGPVPRLLDEWQTSPVLWNHVRREVDERHAAGRFLLTGSAIPVDDTTRHSGAGRFARVHMRPMTLVELWRSTASLSLARLLRGDGGACPDPGLTVEGLVDEAGGWLAWAATTWLSRFALEGQSRIRRKPCPSNSRMRSDVRRGTSLLAVRGERMAAMDLTLSSQVSSYRGGRACDRVGRAASPEHLACEHRPAHKGAVDTTEVVLRLRCISRPSACSVRWITATRRDVR